MQQLNCVSLMLLLGVLVAVLSSVVVATARRESPMASIRDQGVDQARAASILTDAPEAAAKDAEEVTRKTRRRRTNDERVKCRRFRTRKTTPSSSSQVHFFSGRIPFTADYGKIKRHPPKHN